MAYFECIMTLVYTLNYAPSPKRSSCMYNIINNALFK